MLRRKLARSSGKARRRYSVFKKCGKNGVILAGKKSPQMSQTYIHTIISRLEKASREAEQSFGGLSSRQLNWKPAEEAWSAGQCLEHLIVSNRTYFPQLEAVAKGARKATFWERIPFLPNLWGNMLLRSITPIPKKKMKAPGVFRPARSQVAADIVRQFTAHNQELIRRLRNLGNQDLKRTIITSPAASFITYSLHDAVTILANHEERHLLQARRVMAREGFPGK